MFNRCSPLTESSLIESCGTQNIATSHSLYEKYSFENFEIKSLRFLRVAFYLKVVPTWLHRLQNF